jgi:phosphoglycerate dehydrogenase-like enzyme
MFGYGHHFNVLLAAPAAEVDQSLTTTDAILRLKSLRETIVTSTAGMHAADVEMAFLQCWCSPGIPRMLDNQRRGNWERWPQPLLYRKTVVILGVGAIAVGLAKRCKAFEMQVIGVSATPRALPDFDRMMPRSELEQAAALADFLVALLPLSPATRHIVNGKVFAAMKPCAFFINLARGGICDEDALLQALAESRIAGAGLDVFQADPLPADHPLWKAERVIITPRLGGISDIYQQQFIPYLEANLKCYAEDRWGDMLNVVPH